MKSVFPLSALFILVPNYNSAQEVASFSNEEKPAGSYEIGFDAAGLTSGIYFYRLRAAGFSHTKKLILLK